MKLVTNIFLKKGDQVLLGMKKRGFGAGKWNGMGGKVHEGETIAWGAIREVEEEIGVKILPADLADRGAIRFFFDGNPDWNQDMRIFVCEVWSGDPAESEETRPQWYAIRDIPFSMMWVDDFYWVPKILAGRKVDGEFYFNSDGTAMERFSIREL